MLCLDLSLPTPAGNLAADEVLLDACEAGHSDELLRFWEPRDPFVVVGYANKVATEVNVPACEAAGAPIFRRCSGGGTVVQLPGGLNYSLILRIDEHGPTRNISAANEFIMERNRRAIEAEVRRQTADIGVAVRGHTDLALVTHPPAPGLGATSHESRSTETKFAGNAQRRRKHFLLFHGTLLLNCDLTLISKLLRMPSLQPDYRADRPHADFVTNLQLPAETVKAALAEIWNAKEELKHPPLAAIDALAKEKYSTREWNFKF